MGKVREFIEDFKQNYSIDEKIITIVFTSLFMPWWYSLMVILIAGIYVFKKQGIQWIKEIKGGTVLMILPLYLLIVSLFKMNWYGFALSLYMLPMFLLVLHYRRHIHQTNHHKIVSLLH